MYTGTRPSWHASWLSALSPTSSPQENRHTINTQAKGIGYSTICHGIEIYFDLQIFIFFNKIKPLSKRPKFSSIQYQDITNSMFFLTRGLEHKSVSHDTKPHANNVSLPADLFKKMCQFSTKGVLPKGKNHHIFHGFNV